MIFMSVSIILVLVEVVNCDMEAFVLGGNLTKIERFPHSVFLNILCQDAFICGGSILNQLVVLTAGHCLEECTNNNIQRDIFVKYGHENLDQMTSMFIRHFMIHEAYDDDLIANDIALVVTKYPIKLGRVAKRVVVLESPPETRTGYMAGWGSINEEHDISRFLLSTVQEIQPSNVCEKIMGPLPPGTFCAGPIHGTGAPNQGDSGSALVFKGYIQIGIVSYNVENFTAMVYTNVSYHFNWIKKNTEWFVCRHHRKNKIL